MKAIETKEVLDYKTLEGNQYFLSPEEIPAMHASSARAASAFVKSAFSAM